MEIKDGYFLQRIDSKFITRRMFFFMWMPVVMSNYEKLKNYFIEKGYTIDWNIGMVEKSSLFGFGFIGLAHSAGEFEIHDEFICYKMVGSYKLFKDAYKKIKTDYPLAIPCYHAYLTDPNVTEEDKYITHIYFKA